MSDTGVVDPLGVPAWIREPAERWWREMPPLARVFVGLAVLDVIGRSLGFLAPTIDWAYLTPLGFITAYAPHDLWILLPALLLIRRPDAPTATPWIFRGAVVVAVVEVVRGPLQAILFAPSVATIWALAGGAATLGLAAAWVLIARGLDHLTPREPSPTVAGIANVGAALTGILAAFYLADALVRPAYDTGDPGFSQAMALASLATPIQVLGWAYLLWVVIRGLGDVRRPAVATMLAGAGAIMAAFIVPIATLLARLFAAVGANLNDGSGFGELYMIVSWLGDFAGPALIAAAFALGLAEPPTRYVPARPADTGLEALPESPESPGQARDGTQPPGGPAILAP